jgi:hypothetical protein
LDFHWLRPKLLQYKRILLSTFSTRTEKTFTPWQHLIIPILPNHRISQNLPWITSILF